MFQSARAGRKQEEEGVGDLPTHLSLDLKQQLLAHAMDADAAGPSALPTPPPQKYTVKSGNTVLLKLPTGDVKSVKIDKGSCVDYRILSFLTL